IACEGKTAHIAYILMAERTDKNTDSSAAGQFAHNNGQYSMYITVNQPGQGGPNAIKAGENLNPVKTLRMRYDAWRRAASRTRWSRGARRWPRGRTGDVAHVECLQFRQQHSYTPHASRRR